MHPPVVLCRLAFAAKSWCWDDQKLRSVALIDRYLARSIAVPLLGSLVLAAMLLVLDKMLRLFEYVVDAGGPVSVVWRMLANLLPEYLALGIPIGLMLGILLAFRKLALSSELDALRGIGIGFGRLLRVPYLYAMPLMVLNLVIVGYLEPYSHYRYEGLALRPHSGALGASIKVGEFNRLGKRADAAHRPQREQGHPAARHLRPDGRPVGMTVAATAERGRFLSTDDPDTILFRLNKGRLVQESPKFSTPRTLAFDSYDLPISLPVIDQFRRRGGTSPTSFTCTSCARVGYGGGATGRDADARRPGQAQLPPGRGGDDADAAAARGGARGAAQAQHLGARHLRRDRDRRRLSQGQSICASRPAPRAGSTRSSPCGCRCSCCRR